VEVANPTHRSHLPLLFVGMEHIMLSNHAMADESLNAANVMCDGDPLLYNERGVMAYNHGEYVNEMKKGTHP
jgi:anaphase-promoting complex subunit 6